MKTLVALSGLLAAALCTLALVVHRPVVKVAPAPAAVAAAPDLSPGELLEPGPRLKASSRALGLSGQRVRLVGFMAHLELPPRGAFYLTGRPVRGDEAGGGTADLPPDAVLVVVPGAPDQPVDWVGGELAVSGAFAVGNRPGPDGHPAAFRLTVEGPLDGRLEHLGQPHAEAALNTHRKESP